MKTLRIRIITGLVTIAFLAALSLALLFTLNTKNLFTDYINEYRITRQIQWTRILADHYVQRGSWQGVYQILPVSREHRMMGMMRGRTVISSEMVILAASNGNILAATERFDSQFLTKDELQRASAIRIDDEVIGYVYLKMQQDIPGLATMESQFLNSVFYSSIGGGTMIALIAALIGISFSNRLIRPLKQLTDSAKNITKGDWGARVILDRDDELGELAQAFNVMTEKLQETEKARKNLVADVAHELRNPLATIRAQLESIQEGVTKPEPQIILSLNDEVIRLSKLVNDLQELSLAEVGRLRLNKEKIRLDMLMHNVISLFEGAFQEKEIVLKVDIPELSQIKIDSQKITQVLVNLLANAVRHTPVGHKIDILGSEKEREVIIEIYNEGAPIATNDLPHIFNRFYRSDKGRTREQGGTGLGLAITKGLIEAHGGTIGVLNDGRGVKFFFTLPK